MSEKICTECGRHASDPEIAIMRQSRECCFAQHPSRYATLTDDCQRLTIARLRARVEELEARYERCHCGSALAPSGLNHCEDCPRGCPKCQSMGADCGVECRR